MTILFVTPGQLAGLPDMPGTERGVRLRAQAENWPWRPRKARGGGREYDARCLPVATREALIKQALAAQPALTTTEAAPAAGAPIALISPSPQSVAAAGVPAKAAAVADKGAASVPAVSSVPAVPMNRRDPLSFKDWQRDAAVARAAVIRMVMDAARAGGCSVDGAIDILNRQVEDGSADDAAVRLLERANVRRREGRAAALNRATFFRWKRAYELGGVEALAPEETHHEKLPPWARLALDLYRKPQKPSVQYVVEKLPEAIEAARLGVQPPSYGQVNRFLRDKVGAIARNDGRLGPKELKGISPFVRRDTSKLWPGDVYTADGHTFKAEVAHPAHGRPFRPEITTVLDVATRRVVGWSTALDENSYGVLDAQRRAFMAYGVCAIWYVDRGAGFDNSLQKDPMLGIAARIGFEIKHSLPYNSQARGLEERSHQTVLVRAARKLPTFVGAAMDREAKNRVFKLVRRDVKATGASRLLMPWAAFPPYIQQAMNEYNDRPHRALPRVRGEDGRLRHMSPNEAWAQAVADGFRPVEIDRDEARDLWWPQKAVKCIRGELRLFGKTYFNVGLAEYHDEVLRVAYDIGDAQQVIVRDLKGRFLCEAQLEGNLRDYFAESVLAEAARKRAEGRLRRLDAKREEVEQELHGSRVIEHAPSPTFDWAAVDTTPQSVAMERDQSWESERAKDLGSQSQSVSAAQAATSEVSPNGDQPLTDFAVTASTACSRGEKPDGPSQQTPPVARPFFTWSRDRYEWLMQHRDQWLEQDRAFLQHYVSSEDYALLREMFEAEGIAWREKDGPNEAAG